jgi:type VI secretion system secreted protein VgrG
MTDSAPLLPRPQMSMTSPLGDGVLVPAALGLEEALSEPFLCILDVVSKRATIDPNQLLFQPVCAMLQSRDGVERHVHGLVRRLAATGSVGRDLCGYRMEIVPALWFLTQTEDCRIFENKTTQDIVDTILGEHKVKVTFRVAAGKPRPFTAQYNETDLDFITRLMQEDGWFYWFVHDAASHTLIIADTTGSFAKIPDGPLRPGPGEQVDVLATWQPADAVTLGKVSMADYDPEEPNTAPQGETATTLSTPGGEQRDPFHWPALARSSDDVRQLTRRRMEAAEVAATLSHGAAFNPAFQPGGRISVIERPGAAATDFLLARVSHQASNDTWRNGTSAPAYANSFTVFPAKLPWRPQQTVRRPRMEGIHSALVIGPEGQEIHTDKLGRVKLRFRWDRRGDATAGGAIWVRVMRPWADGNTGWSFIPRVGSEVAVAFVDGDPDRPVVVGQLHNAADLPPWPLPDQKTRSGLRTRSTPDGGSDDYSELSFDDRKGAEQVFLHAQRDLAVEVEHDATHQIDNNRSVTLKQGNDTLTVQQGSRTVDVTSGNHTIKSNTGDIAIKTSLGAVSIEAMKTITLKVGGSSITLSQSGVTIKGMIVQVQGQATTSVQGPIVKLSADGMLTAAGGVIMLN